MVVVATFQVMAVQHGLHISFTSAMRVHTSVIGAVYAKVNDCSVRIIIIYQGHTEVCGLRDQRSKWRNQGSEGWDQGSQAMGSGSAVFRDQGSGCTSFVGSGTKICDAFDIKDQKFGYKNGISNVQKHTSL